MTRQVRGDCWERKFNEHSQKLGVREAYFPLDPYLILPVY